MHRLRYLCFVVAFVATGCATRAEIPAPATVAVVPSAPPAILPSPPGEVTEPPAIDSASTAEPTATGTAITPEATDPVPIMDPLPSPTTPPCLIPGRIETGALNSFVAGEPMNYRIYLPPCYGLDGHVYPALYMLGGNIHDESIWDTLGLDEAAETAIDDGRLPPLLIVMPDNGWLANTTTSGPNSYEGFVVNELIPYVETTYCGWPEREGRAVGGLSRGGYWSLMMAFRRPALFGSVGAHSPALIDSHAGPAEEPAATGATNDLDNLRIWIDIGERDPYLIAALPVHESLTAAGVAHEWNVKAGTHEEAYWRANLVEYLTWYTARWMMSRDALPLCAATP